MLRMLTAHTFELDDPKVALEEILSQLDLPSQQLPQTAGFVTCSPDFIETGMVREICAALPFPIAGCTTLTNATRDVAGTNMLALCVLTSDTCHFAVVQSAPLTHDLQQPIQETYEQALTILPAPPAMALVFAPLLRAVGGELILEALDKTMDGLPIFGTIACDPDTAEYSNSFTLFQGEPSRNALSMLLISGDISPRFYMEAISEDRIQKQKAIITASEGSVLKEVNGVSAMQYLESIGLAKGGGVEAMSSIPFIVNYNDGTPPMARAIYMLTPEGYAVCGGAMPVDATLSLGSVEYDDVLETADATAERIMRDDPQGVIMFPCLGRNMMLGTDIFAEIHGVQLILEDEVPYHLSYSGGEICPVYDKQGKPVNRFHNFSFIACAFLEN